MTARIVAGVVTGLDPSRPLTAEERALVREAQRQCNEDFFRLSKQEWAEMGGLPIPEMPKPPRPEPEPPPEPAVAVPPGASRLYTFLATGRDPEHPEEVRHEPPSHEMLTRIRTRALRRGMDPDVVDRALINYLASYEPVRHIREPGEDDE